MKKRILSILTALALIVMLFPQRPEAAAPEDFRAVWISTVYNLDYPSKPTPDAGALRREADAILDGCRDMGMNAVILQVRPSADALYPSDLFPWSVYLTGSQDTAPSGRFDPLAYWIEGAHARGMQLHAWINPYRITKKGDAEFNALSNKHPAKLHPDWVSRYSDGNYYFDPGVPQVRDLVADGAAEIINNYPVDGIHIDDYFYPGSDFDDAASFEAYGGGFSSLADWRRENTSLLVQKLHKTAAAGGVPFGVSPAGIWANADSFAEGSATNGGETYFSHYADTRKWVKNGWLDYIAPQIYWEIGHDKADYETLARWWADAVEGTGVTLYIGMADYKAGGSGAWSGIDEIQRQIRLNASIPGVSGEIHFRYRAMTQVPGLPNYYSSAYAA